MSFKSIFSFEGAGDFSLFGVHAISTVEKSCCGWDSTYGSDPFWRVTSVTAPYQTGTTTTTTYTYTPNSIESALRVNGGAATVDILTTLDGLGRVHISQRKQGPSAGAYDSVETDYDADGRVSRVTVPYSAGQGVTNSTAPATTYQYDALSRPTQVTDGGGGQVNFAVVANANYSSWINARLGPIIEAGENSTWQNLLGNVQAHCSSGGPK